MSAGIWGSAFTILLTRVLHDGLLPDDTIKSMLNTGDLRQELCMYLSMMNTTVLLAMLVTIYSVVDNNYILQGTKLTLERTRE